MPGRPSLPGGPRSPGPIRRHCDLPAAIRPALSREMDCFADPVIGRRLAPRREAARTLPLDFPLMLRPSVTLGGLGGGIAYNREELEELGARALAYSPTREVLVEESVLGWKEFELEVMRDRADNVVIICSIENVDPMGVHTGEDRKSVV